MNTKIYHVTPLVLARRILRVGLISNAHGHIWFYEGFREIPPQQIDVSALPQGAIPRPRLEIATAVFEIDSAGIIDDRRYPGGMAWGPKPTKSLQTALELCGRFIVQDCIAPQFLKLAGVFDSITDFYRLARPEPLTTLIAAALGTLDISFEGLQFESEQRRLAEYNAEYDPERMADVREQLADLHSTRRELRRADDVQFEALVIAKKLEDKAEGERRMAVIAGARAQIREMLQAYERRAGELSAEMMMMRNFN
ncbi:MAG TPA: hypothetical protein VGJ15_06250 [Pirellulales bacterium]